MYIKMEYVQKRLENKLEASHIPNDSNLSSFVLYESSIQTFEEDLLYLCMVDDLSEKTKEAIGLRPLNFIFFSREGCDLSSFEQTNYLFIKADLSGIFICVNEMGDLFKGYNEWEQKLLGLIAAGKNYQDAIEIAGEMIPFPMAIMDINHQVFAISKDCESMDTLLFSLSHGYGYDFLDIINRSNPTLEEVEQAGVCEVTSCISGNRLRVYRIKKDIYSSYFIGFHKSDPRPFETADVFLLDYFVEFLEKLVIAVEKKRSSSSSDFAYFLTDLIMDPDYTEDYLTKNIARFHLNTVRSWRLLCVKFTNNLQFRTTYHYEIIKQIHSIIPGSYCALINSSIAILVNSATDMTPCLKELRYLLITNAAICAESSVYNDLGKTHQVWSQLQFMLKNRPLEDKSTELFYSDFYKAHCLSVLQEEFPPQTLCHSALHKIQKFDARNHTNYLSTLISYLQNNCSMNTTATLLNIHRNSLLYRIQKIEEILGFEIANSRARLPMLLSSFLIKKD